MKYNAPAIRSARTMSRELIRQAEMLDNMRKYLDNDTECEVSFCLDVVRTLDEKMKALQVVAECEEREAEENTRCRRCGDDVYYCVCTTGMNSFGEMVW